jgi:membrane-bound lytic murein transglycosylase B
LKKGKVKLEENRPLLERIYKKYGVQPSILVAFWGLETNYGKHVGQMELLPHDPRVRLYANQYALEN